MRVSCCFALIWILFWSKSTFGDLDPAKTFPVSQDLYSNITFLVKSNVFVEIKEMSFTIVASPTNLESMVSQLLRLKTNEPSHDPKSDVEPITSQSSYKPKDPLPESKIPLLPNPTSVRNDQVSSEAIQSKEDSSQQSENSIHATYTPLWRRVSTENPLLNDQCAQTCHNLVNQINADSVNPNQNGTRPKDVGFLAGSGFRNRRSTVFNLVKTGDDLNDAVRLLESLGVDVFSCFEPCPLSPIKMSICPKINHKKTKRSTFEKMEYLEVNRWSNIGKCDAGEYEIKRDPSIVCRSWQDWTFSKDNTKICTYGVSCERGKYDNGGVCVSPSEMLEVMSVCSLSSFQLASLTPAHSSLNLEPDDERICKIGEFVVRPCKGVVEHKKLISYVGYNGETYLITKKHHFKTVPDMKDMRNYVCTDCEANCESCNGDTEYKENFPSSVRNTSCTCSTAYKKPYGTVSVTIEGITYPLEFRFSKRFSVEIMHKDDESVSSPCQRCTASCKGSVIMMKGSFEGIKWVRVCASSYCTVMAFTSKFHVPIGTLLFSRKVEFWLITEKEVESGKFEVICEVEDDCQLISCKYCFERFANPQCYSWLEYFALICVALGTLVILSIIVKGFQIVLMVFKLVRLVVSMTYFILKLMKICFKRTKGSISLRTRKVYAMVDNEEDEMDIVRADYRPRQYYRPGPALLAIILIIPLVSSCTHTTNYVFSSHDCVISANKYTCMPTSKVFLSLGGLNTDTCLSIKQDNKPIGSVKVSIKEVRVRCSEELLYWTFLPSGHVKKQCRCWGSGRCFEKDCSKDRLSNDQAKEIGYNSSEMIGIIGCKEVSSSLFSSCAGFEGCCYFNAGFKPKSHEKVYKVSKCSSMYFELVLRMESKLGAGIPVETEMELMAGYPKKVDGINIAFTDPSIPWKDSYSSCIIRPVDSRRTYLAKCNKASENLQGLIGEVKCPSLESIHTNLSACSMAPGMIKVTRAQDNLDFDFQVSSIDKMMGLFELPKVTSTYKASIDNRGLWFSDSFTESFSLHLTLPDVSVQAYSTMATCDVNFVSTHGCYDCIEGAILIIDISCSDYPTVGILSCKGFGHDVPFVVKAKGELPIKFSTSQSEINSVVSWEAGRSTGNFSFNGHYIALTFAERLDEVDQVNTTDIKSDSFQSIRDFFKIFTLRSVFETFLSIFLIIGFFWILFIIIRWRCTARLRSRSKSY